MTAKPSNKHSRNEQDGSQPPERVRDDESSGDDNSVSDDDSVSSSSSSESSTENTSTGSPPPDISMNGDQIRKNARELLLSSPDSTKMTGGGGAISSSLRNPAANASGYQSYHDAPTVRVSHTASSPSQFVGSDTVPTPPWASQNESDQGLSMTDVASMAFTCVAHCLTEGYRAASSYYGGYDQSQYPSVSGSDNSQNYQQVSGYHNEGYGDKSASYNYNNDQSSSTNISYNNGYTDGYQSKFNDHPNQHREVMERGSNSTQSNNDGDYAAGQTSGQDAVQKEEWATVHVPSTYQGGRVGSGQ